MCIWGGVGVLWQHGFGSQGSAAQGCPGVSWQVYEPAPVAVNAFSIKLVLGLVSFTFHSCKVTPSMLRDVVKFHTQCTHAGR